MIFILSIVGYWLSQLSSIPQWLMFNLRYKVPKWFIWIISKLECTKCVCFWIGMFYFYDVISAILCSFVGIVISRIYYKLLS